MSFAKDVNTSVVQPSQLLLTQASDRDIVPSMQKTEKWTSFTKDVNTSVVQPSQLLLTQASDRDIVPSMQKTEK
jgi:phosphohistidine swiveling domain-containing protein